MHHRPSGHLDGMLAHQDFAQFPSDRSMVLSSHWLLHVVFGPSCRQHQPTTLVLDDIGVCPGPLHWHGGVCGAPEAGPFHHHLAVENKLGFQILGWRSVWKPLGCQCLEPKTSSHLARQGRTPLAKRHQQFFKEWPLVRQRSSRGPERSMAAGQLQDFLKPLGRR